MTPLFRSLNEADAGMQPSPDVDARLLREVRAIGRARRMRTRGALLAAAAAIVLAVAISFWRSDRSPAPIGVAPGAVITSASRDVATEFFPLAYAYVPAFSTHIVRLVLPRRALASFGLGSFEIDTGAAATVTADVVVGEDGLARYVRFVRPASN